MNWKKAIKITTLSVVWFAAIDLLDWLLGSPTVHDIGYMALGSVIYALLDE